MLLIDFNDSTFPNRQYEQRKNVFKKPHQTEV